MSHKNSFTQSCNTKRRVFVCTPASGVVRVSYCEEGVVERGEVSVEPAEEAGEDGVHAGEEGCRDCV